MAGSSGRKVAGLGTRKRPARTGSEKREVVGGYDALGTVRLARLPPLARVVKDVENLALGERDLVGVVRRGRVCSNGFGSATRGELTFLR